MKPKLLTPRRVWVNDYGMVLGARAYTDWRAAEAGASNQPGVLQIEFVEVMPEPRKKKA